MIDTFFVNLLFRVTLDRRSIETPEVGLSRGMKWLNQEYAETFNERHHRVGHLFQGRFKGILVERDGHLHVLIRCIVLNPVRCHAVTFAGDYRWSNYRATAGLQPAPSWLEIDWTLDQFGADRASACEAYRQYVADAREASYNPWERVVGQMYLGGAAYCDRMQALVSSKERSREHPRAQRLFVRPDLNAVTLQIADRFGVSPDDLKRKARGQARKTLACLAVDDAGLTLRSITEWMGVSNWAASKMRLAARELYATDREYRRKLDEIRAALS
jgi:hypothetical protein